MSIASFANVVGAPVWIVSASFSFAFSITKGIVKKLLKTTKRKNIKKNKKKKHNINFATIINEARNYRELKRKH